MNKKSKKTQKKDMVYLLKLVLYFILGCLWVQIGAENGLVLPVGFIIGIAFAMHDHFAIDRKLEFAILLIAAVISFIAPIGFVLKIG